MSNLIPGPYGAFYDATTGQFVGFKDLSGRENMVGEVTGTIAQMLAVTPVAGSLWLTDTGMEFVGKLIPGGTTYAWAPRGGRQRIYGRPGSLAVPLSAFTGGASGAITIPGGNITIPTGLLVPGLTGLRIFGKLRRVGANATASINIRLGTAGTSADPMFYTTSMAATTNLDVKFDAEAEFSSTTSYTSSAGLVPNTAAATALVDRTANVNTAAPMIVSADVSLANAADAFNLVALCVEVVG